MSEAGQVLPLELVPGLDAALTELEMVLADQRAMHARLLRRVLQVGQLLTRGGCELGAPPHVALVLNVSETTAAHLLVQAELLAMLPGGLEALDSGLLGVEQAGAFTRAVHELPMDVVRQVWQQLRDRLIQDAGCGGVPPARLKTLVAGWVIQADPDAAVDRREGAQDDASVDYRKRDDGLVDLFAMGLTGPNAQVVLSRIRARAAAWGAGDERPAGRRRLEALVDLILGRDQLPISERTSCRCSVTDPALRTGRAGRTRPPLSVSGTVRTTTPTPPDRHQVPAGRLTRGRGRCSGRRRGTADPLVAAGSDNPPRAGSTSGS